MLCAIYLRLSKEDEDKDDLAESESIINQRAMLVEYATSQGWEIYKIYTDEDYSGIDNNRPAFNQMLADAEQKRFQIVLCKTQARFSRDIEVVEKYINNRFILWGIRFVGLVDHADTAIATNKKARQINGLVNEWYLDDLSANIKSAFKVKRQRGDYMATYALYGFLKDKEAKGGMAEDLEAADVIRLIFSLYFFDGYGYTSIVYELNEKNIDSPAWYKYKKGIAKSMPKGINQWCVKTVSDILSNPMYAGHLVQGKRTVINYKTGTVVKLPEDQWDIVYNHHVAIVTQELFDRVQELKKFKNARVTKGTRKVHPLSNKLKCSDCGSKMVLQGKEPHKYYVCSMYATRSRLACTNNHSIRMSAVEDIVYGEIKKIMRQIKIKDDDFGDIQILDRQEELRKNYNKKRDIAVCRLEENKNMLINLYKDKLKGIINEEQYGLLSESIQIDIKNSEQSLDAISDEINRLEQQKEKTQNTKEIVKRFIDAESLTRDMVNSFIKEIKISQKDKVTKEQAIDIEWNI